MENFTAMSKSMNAKEYTRQYVTMESESTDVTGYSPSVEYAFDCSTTDAVHGDIATVSDEEKTGTDAERYIYSVDLTKTSGAGFVATKRLYSVIPDAEGDSMDAYTYSGSFKTKGNIVKGVAVLNSDHTEITSFTPDTGVERLLTINVSAVAGQIAGAQILINSKVIVTDSNGIAEIELPAGTYPFTITKALYTTKSDSVVISTASVYKPVTIVLA
jgi:hypothetical protein